MKVHAEIYGRQTALRPSVETPLSKWIERHNSSIYEVAKATGIPEPTVRMWTRGKCLPSLVGAFRIEALTSGEVAVAKWMGIPVAVAQWNELEANVSVKRKKAGRAV